jgi:hypothetical protein
MNDFPEELNIMDQQRGEMAEQKAMVWDLETIPDFIGSGSSTSCSSAILPPSNSRPARNKLPSSCGPAKPIIRTSPPRCKSRRQPRTNPRRFVLYLNGLTNASRRVHELGGMGTMRLLEDMRQTARGGNKIFRFSHRRAFRARGRKDQ